MKKRNAQENHPFGICSVCRTSRSEYPSLEHAKEGERFVIKEYMNERCSHGKARHLRHRWRNHQRCENMHLLHMGIRIGDEIEVVSNAGNGQLVIACSGNRYVLGNCSSRRLLVERLPN